MWLLYENILSVALKSRNQVIFINPAFIKGWCHLSTQVVVDAELCFVSVQLHTLRQPIRKFHRKGVGPLAGSRRSIHKFLQGNVGPDEWDLFIVRPIYFSLIISLIEFHILAAIKLKGQA